MNRTIRTLNRHSIQNLFFSEKIFYYISNCACYLAYTLCTYTNTYDFILIQDILIYLHTCSLVLVSSVRVMIQVVLTLIVHIYSLLFICICYYTNRFDVSLHLCLSFLFLIQCDNTRRSDASQHNISHTTILFVYTPLHSECVHIQYYLI